MSCSVHVRATRQQRTTPAEGTRHHQITRAVAAVLWSTALSARRTLIHEVTAKEIAAPGVIQSPLLPTAVWQDCLSHCSVCQSTTSSPMSGLSPASSLGSDSRRMSTHRTAGCGRKDEPVPHWLTESRRINRPPVNYVLFGVRMGQADVALRGISQTHLHLEENLCGYVDICANTILKLGLTTKRSILLHRTRNHARTERPLHM